MKVRCKEKYHNFTESPRRDPGAAALDATTTRYHESSSSSSSNMYIFHLFVLSTVLFLNLLP